MIFKKWSQKNSPNVVFGRFSFQLWRRVWLVSLRWVLKVVKSKNTTIHGSFCITLFKNLVLFQRLFQNVFYTLFHLIRHFEESPNILQLWKIQLKKTPKNCHNRNNFFLNHLETFGHGWKFRKFHFADILKSQKKQRSNIGRVSLMSYCWFFFYVINFSLGKVTRT